MGAKAARFDFFHAQIEFVQTLVSLSDELAKVPRADRREVLRSELRALNLALSGPATVYVAAVAERGGKVGGTITESGQEPSTTAPVYTDPF